MIAAYGSLKRNMIFYVLEEFNYEEEENIQLFGEEAVLEENEQEFYKEDVVS